MIDLYLRLNFIEEKHNKMKLKFSLKLSLLVFFAVAHGFSAAYSSTAISPLGMDTEENTKVLAGMKYIAKQYKKRCDDFNAKPVETSAGSLQTERIIDLLSNPEKVSRQEASEEQKREIAQSVMATIFVHGGLKKLTPNNLKEGDTFYRHFRALELIEDLSVESRTYLKADYLKDDIESFSTFLSSKWEIYRDLETYSSITKDMFSRWFNAALKEHRGGFVKLAEIAEQKIQKATTEQLRQDKIKATAEEAKQRLIELAVEEGRLRLLESAKKEGFSTPDKATKPQTSNGDDAYTDHKKHNPLETPSKRPKATERKPAFGDGSVLDAIIDAEKVSFTYSHVAYEEDANFKSFGKTSADFKQLIESADMGKLAEIYQQMNEQDESYEIASEAKEITRAQLITAFTDYCLGSGQLVLASVLLQETPICIWMHKSGQCVLANIYLNGNILSDFTQINLIKARIKSLDERLVYLYHTTDDFYDSLIIKKKDVAKSSTMSVVATQSSFLSATVSSYLSTYWSTNWFNPASWSNRTRLSIAGGVSITSIALFKFLPRLLKKS